MMRIRLAAVFCLAGAAALAQEAATDAPPSRQALGEARGLFMQGYYRSAIEKYEPLTGGDATRLAATLGIVDCFEQQGKYEEALARLDAVKIDGAASADWHEAVARFRRHLGRYREAIDAYEAALARDDAHFAAHLGLGEVHETLGDKKKAIDAYAWFDELLANRLPERADELTWAARGLYRFAVLSQHRNLTYRTRYVLHDLLQPAYEKVDRTYWPARLASAELLLRKHNTKQARADFDAARRLNTKLPDAYVGLGRIALESWDFDAAEKRVKTALEINPDHVGAMQLLAAVRMTERKYKDAAAEVEKALDVNPNDPVSLSLAAAACIRMGDDEKARRFQDRVAAVNPRCGRMHFIIAEWLSAARQFPEGEKHYLQAIALDPEDSRPRAELGLMYMQWGKEAEARAVLDEAWGFDPFNRQTYNTLNLLDELEKFDVHASERFLIHYDREKDAVLAPYFADYLESIHEEVCADFEHEPADKTIIEIFPNHEQFGVRITGKPWIHTIGASTGRVIALDAPRKDAAGEPFNWERVLRHEFTHTVTLAATRNRIPHWFTEGLAVLQEDAPRSYRWQRMLTGRVRHGTLFTLESINWGFIRPRRPDDRELAYAQSEWMCEYLIAQHGYGIINQMLAGFRDGKTQDEVFRDIVGVESETFSEGFVKWAAEQVRSWGFDADPVESVLKLKALLLLKPKDAKLRGRLAKALVFAGAVDGAHEAADAALELDPNNVDALEVLTRIKMARAEAAKESHQRDEIHEGLRVLLERLAAAKPASPIPAEMFGQIALAREQYDEALKWYERLKRMRPSNPVSYQALAAIHLRRNRPEKALTALIEIWRTDENDPALPLRIARIFEEKEGRTADAALWYRRSIAIDPYDPEPHAALAVLYATTGDTRSRIRELRALCALEPGEATHFATLAEAYAKAGDGENAAKAARQAVKLDSDSPAARLVGEEGESAPPP